MSTTDTDFWSRIDAASTSDEPSDEPSQPSLAIDPQAADDEAADDEAADAQPRDESPRNESLGESQVRSPASPEPQHASPAGPQKSKSQRIREFMNAQPGIRNRDIVEALAEHGVTAADVSNVRTQLRKKAEKQQKAKARTEASAAAPAAERATGGARKTERGAKASEAATTSASARPASDEIAMAEIEAGLNFIEQAGSIERARQIVDLIARIRNVSLTR